MPSKKNNGRLAYMRVYVNDILADEIYDGMTPTQGGAYWRLLLRAWQQGASLPDDDLKLASYTKLSAALWKKNKSSILAPWNLGEDGRWRQKRQVSEYEKAKQEVEAKRIGGAAGGKFRPSREGILKHTLKSPQGYETYLEVEAEAELDPYPEVEAEDARDGVDRLDGEVRKFFADSPMAVWNPKDHSDLKAVVQQHGWDFVRKMIEKVPAGAAQIPWVIGCGRRESQAKGAKAHIPQEQPKSRRYAS